jgi:glycosidase
MEFHIDRSIRRQLALEDVLFSYNGNVVFANVAASRKLAKGLNDLRSHKVGQPFGSTEPANAGALFAMGLIDELSHAIIALYRKQIDPGVHSEAIRWFDQRLGRPEVDRLLLAFTEQFPGSSIYRGEQTPAQWLAGSTDGLPNREATLEELTLLWLANQNPAFAQFRELFADDALKQSTPYTPLTAGLPAYFATRPPLSKEAGTLIEALRAPMQASPDSLIGQLEFIRSHWAPFLGEVLDRTLLAIDLVREEDIAIWMRFHPGGQGPSHGQPGWQADGFRGDEYIGFDEDFIIGPDGVRRRRYASDHQAALNEYEAFSPDQAWMPTVVMIAKNTYVWLEQLSKKYLRHIHRLDQIPDEELRTLADRGMTALWLIGLWERSSASQTIKRLRGSYDAVASAYSLKEYNIANDLGGNQAYEHLRDRAAAYGLRLASDMVPNHMGIDSSWVIEHPDWFINRSEPPFPSYSFNGPDLSSDSRAEIKIEDHYYDQTDAAVAFRLRTHNDGQTRYIYHGNDGTTFAWNDTAQLDYSKAEVREHVMQTILHVARLFPIIRFDAAMVLAKRHVQRLWFPLPGVGGSIPSRAENAMSDEAFNELMPHEFWREVVDRVAVEVPGTLLLAEAFWLLEGYFVRTLGMHRVYNSAFMNMLRDEENAKYRSYLKKTIEFDPDIMKRYVNFMSNPDERTAIDQFGDGDKYFGTCTLLATLPGLPMFGHGQIEGFTERYGMDFKEARIQEVPNQGLIDRYQREITPLLRNRNVFAESEHFILYDFWLDHGVVDENVIAYSNRSNPGAPNGDEDRALVVYNNVYPATRGTLHTSAASFDKGSGRLIQRSLAEALALPMDNEAFVAYRDHKAGLEFIRRASSIRDHGLNLELGGFQYIVLQSWRSLYASAEYPWDRLCDELHGHGVPSLDEAVTALRLRPLHHTLANILSRPNIQAFATIAAEQAAVDAQRTGLAVPAPIIAKELSSRPESASFADGVERSAAPSAPSQKPGISNPSSATSDPAHDPRLTGFLNACRAFYAQITAERHIQFDHGDHHPTELEALMPVALRIAAPGAGTDAGPQAWAPIVAVLILEAIPGGHPDLPRLYDRLRLRQCLGACFPASDLLGEDAWRAAARVRIRLRFRGPLLATLRSSDFWSDPDVRWLLGVNEVEGVTYFNQQCFEDLTAWLHLTQPLSLLAKADPLPLSSRTEALSEQSEPKGRSGDIPASAGATASVASKRTKASKATVELEGVDQLAAHAKAAGYKVAAFRELLELTPRSKMEPSLALSK